MTDNLMQFMQTGFRVTVGATASLIESLQDEQKRNENINKLGSNWDDLARELEQKGETTEREARQFVDSMWSQPQNGSQTEPTGTPPSSGPSPSATTVEPDTQTELQQLTEQIARLREELEQLREQDAQS
jgi:polyhydroxyalkanoate synthesis regulator phasin